MMDFLRKKLNLLLAIILALSGSVLLIVLFTHYYFLQTSSHYNSDSNSITVFFHKIENDSVQCKRLFPYSISIQDSKNSAEILSRVVRGPDVVAQKLGYVSAFSSQTAELVRSVNIEKSVAYIDLYDLERVSLTDNSLLTKCSKSDLLLPIEQTLQKNYRVSNVVYAIEGSPKRFVNWAKQSCGLLSEKCPEGKFTLAPTNDRQVSSLSKKVTISKPENWYVIYDAAIRTPFDEGSFITKTLLIDQQTESSGDDKPVLPETASSVLVVEKNIKAVDIQSLLGCSNNDGARRCEEVTLPSGSALRINDRSSSTTVETYALQKDTNYYILIITIPFNNTANSSYETAKRIVESVVIK